MDESRIIIDWKEQGDDTYDIELSDIETLNNIFRKHSTQLKNLCRYFLLAIAVSVARLLVNQQQAHL